MSFAQKKLLIVGQYVEFQMSEFPKSKPGMGRASISPARKGEGFWQKCFFYFVDQKYLFSTPFLNALMQSRKCPNDINDNIDIS
ncbi:MAG: hypothetical protein R2788_24975 [Saprospiraceae bacterium]